MTAPVYSPYKTVADSVRQELGTISESGAWLSDDELLDRIMAEVLSTPQTYTFERVSAGSAIATPASLPKFQWRGQPERHTYLLDIDFTGTDGCTYTVNCSGSIVVTGGTEARTSISVTAVPVAFDRVMVKLLTSIATDRCQQVSQSSGGSYSPAQVHDQCLEMAAIWQGVRGA